MMTIDRSMAPTPALPDLNGAARRHPVKALAESLQADDLSGAKRAFAQIVRQAPPDAAWNPDSGLANIGRALRAGDLPMARKAAQVAWEDLKSAHAPGLPKTPEPRTPGISTPEPVVAPTNTGQAVGTRLNVVA